jgi:RNA polymerase sigma factor (sigma-70 family)
VKIGYIGEFTEEQVINGCIMGERKMQQLLYQRFAKQMYGVCLRYAKDEHGAEDILQDGFVKVFRYIGNFRKEGSFEGWVRRIFINTAIEYLRKQVSLYAITNDEGKAIDIEDSNVFDGLEVADLMQMVQSLSPGYRTVFNLYAVEGYSHKEIAEMMQISEGTSKSQLARARQILIEKVNASQKISVKINNGI